MDPPHKSSTAFPVIPPPQAHVDREQRSSIDAVLRQLKSCSRSLLVLSQSQHVESRILDQLFYRGNNQHRTALFWCRIAEIRRYTKRIERMDLYSIVENMRLSFWGPPQSLTNKTLRQAWTHVPDTRVVTFVLFRLVSSRSLVGKMQDRCANAYCHLNLSMQTGAFLQLITTLSGIVARLSMISGELGTAIEVASTTCREMLSISHTQKSIRSPTNPCSPVSDRQLGSGKRLLEREDQRVGFNEVAEDVAWSSAPKLTTSGKAQEIPMTRRSEGEDLTDVDTAVSVDIGSILFSAPTPVLRQKFSKSLASKSSHTALPRTARRKKRDEIDDIFGS